MKYLLSLFGSLLLCGSLFLFSCTAKKIPSEQSKEFLVKLAKERLAYLDSLLSPFREMGNYSFAKMEDEVKAQKLMLEMFTSAGPGTGELEAFARNHPESASALEPYRSRIYSMSNEEQIIVYCMMVLQYANGMEFHALNDFMQVHVATMAVPSPNPVKAGEVVTVKIIPYLSLGEMDRSVHPEFSWDDQDLQFHVDPGGATATAWIPTKGALLPGEKEKEVTGGGRVRYPLINGSYKEIPVSVTYTVVR